MKPYDVEQAKAEIHEAVERAQRSADAAIAEAAEGAIKRLEAQARLFGEHGGQRIETLLGSASHVIVEEIDFQRHISEPTVTLNGLTLYTHYGQLSISAPRGPPPTIPNRKHRVVVFFLPVE